VGVIQTWSGFVPIRRYAQSKEHLAASKAFALQRSQMPTATETMSSSTSIQSSASQPAPISRRALRKTLNDALAIASNAVQLDTAGDYAQAMEAYQQSVDLLDQGIGLMRIQRESGAERPGRDTSHEISQLETIVRARLSTQICSLNPFSFLLQRGYHFFVILMLLSPHPE
jgi:hypothetical protein